MKRMGNFRKGKSHYKYRHGQCGSPLYTVWQRMKQRCLDKNDKRYARYGGRGIKICDKWMDFIGFAEDMSEGYAKGMSLERKDNNGNYYPENCVWIPFGHQAKNRSDTNIIEYKGKRQCVRDWERELGLKKDVLRMRLKHYGWSVEKALSTPARKLTKTPAFKNRFKKS